VILTVLSIRATPAIGAHESWRKVNHLIVIYEENWSFDALFGPDRRGGFGDPSQHVNPQLMRNGQPYAELPKQKPIPAGLPPRPFNLAKYAPPSGIPPDPPHLYYNEQLQIDGGKMDLFVAYGCTGNGCAGSPFPMGFYDTRDMPIGRLAREYVLCDMWFHSMFGASGPNHEFFIGAQPLVWPIVSKDDPPEDLVAKFDKNGNLLNPDAAITPDGYVIGDLQPSGTPTGGVAEKHVPVQTHQTIGDLLSGASPPVPWTWYAGGFAKAMGQEDTNCPGTLAPWHLPFLYFANYQEGQPGRDHIQDECQFFADLENGTLPSVSFVKPAHGYDEHPGISPFLPGQAHLHHLVRAVQMSSAWKDSAIVITFDENGGHWDHVAPPKGDQWGPGTRIPAVIVSPLARHRFVDHTPYETLSILRFIEERWGLPSLNERDANASSFRNAFR
jgi:phospholipase C